MVPPLQYCRSMSYIEIIWLFDSEYTWLLLGTSATKATLALIKYKFDTPGILNISPCPLISIAQGHFIIVSLVLTKLIVSIENKIWMVYNTAHMHIRCITAFNEAPFSNKINTLAICIPHTKVVSLKHFMTMVHYILLGLLSSNVSFRTVFLIIRNEITVKYPS